MTASIKVKQEMVFTIDATKVGEVYGMLSKYMFNVKQILTKKKKKKLVICHSLWGKRKKRTYPTKERKEISRNRATVNFGLMFLLDQETPKENLFIKDFTENQQSEIKNSAC